MSGVEIFAMIVCIVVWGIPCAVCASGLVSLYFEKKKLEKSFFCGKTLPSDDFMVARAESLDLLKERLGIGDSITGFDLRIDFDRINDSSELASLFRYAHFAGYHITIERDDMEWKDDPEYLDPDVFKTDMGEAADMRDQRYMQKYKRYYDPPRSQRDRKLIDRGIISYDEGEYHLCYRVVHRG